MKAHLGYHNDHCAQLCQKLIVAKRLIKSLDSPFHSHTRKILDKIRQVNWYIYADGLASK